MAMDRDTMSALQAALRANVPVILWGAPGTAKTAVLESIAAEMGLGPVVTLTPATHEPADLVGFRAQVGDTAVLLKPDWLVVLERAGKGVLFLDEFSCASPAQQAAALQILQERRVGTYPVPSAVRIVLAANPVAQAAGGAELAAPSANRVIHLPWRPDLAAWTAWLLSHGPGSPAVRGSVAAFLSRCPSHLLAVPADDVQAGGAWPSPRSWTNLCAAVSECSAPTDNVAALLAGGCVGHAATVEWQEWVKKADLPDPEALLAGEEWQVDRARPDRVMAALSSLVAAVIDRHDQARWSRAWELIVLAHDSAQGGAAVAAGTTLAGAARAGSWGYRAPKCVAKLAKILGLAGIM
jgi:hypothetical protein